MRSPSAAAKHTAMAVDAPPRAIETEDVREAVRERYAAAAAAASMERRRAAAAAVITDEQRDVFGSRLYGPRIATSSPTPRSSPRSAAAIRPRSPSCTRARRCSTWAPAAASTCCSRPGGSGRRQGVRPRHDRRDARAGRRNQRQAGVENVEFLKGTIEEMPLPDDSVDVVISNCVINLSGDKPGSSAKPRGYFVRAVGSPSATWWPIPTSTRPRGATCSSGPAASPAP